MQNVQNAEIQQRVINLVELYRTKVGKESQIAQEAKDDYEYWEQFNLNRAIEAIEAGDHSFGEVYGEGSHTEEWIEHLSVNEQLLGHFYVEVAGENAEQDVLDQLLPDVYDKTIFTEEEESFLKSHFKEMVNYIIQTPCDENLKWVHRHDGKDALSIPNEVLELIRSRVHIASDSNVYYPKTAFAQLANLFDGCTFYVDTMFYAWTRIALYANNIDAKELDGNSMPQPYDAIVSYLPKISEDSNTIRHICEAYNNLAHSGKLILLCPSGLLAEDASSKAQKETLESNMGGEFTKAELDKAKVTGDICAVLRRLLVEDTSIKEIIQLPRVMSNNATSGTYCLLIAEKGYEDDATLIDARTASNDTDAKNFTQSFDVAKFDAILKNEGKDPNTGLRKVVKVSAKDLSQHLLIPEVYTVERPLETENPVRLSSLCALESKLVRDVQFDLPENTPCVSKDDLTPLFTGDLDVSKIKTADCPNNPPFVEGSRDYAFDKDGKFIDDFGHQVDTKKGLHVLDYRRSTFLDGKSDVVLYERSAEHGGRVAVVRATCKPYAVSTGILVFHPKAGADVNILAATLRLPIVSRQLVAYQGYGVENHLDDILVPTDKRIIGDERQKMLKEQDVVGDLEVKLTNKEKSLRMRKHALTQSLSSIKAMFVALNTYRKRRGGRLNDLDVISRIQGTTVQDAFEFIHKGIFEMMPALEHIADVEYSFSKAESFDPEEFMEKFIAKEEKGWLNFKPVVTWKKGSNKSKYDIMDVENRFVEIAKGQPLNRITFPKDALEKIFENIISNAKAHAFTDDTRKDYQLKFSWHTEYPSLIIEITTSLLEYGVSTALHHDGHNGIGCNEIDSIMRQYNGKVAIVSTPKKSFTVKYVLTFNDSYVFLPN